jgi:hypothetical protein
MAQFEGWRFEKNSLMNIGNSSKERNTLYPRSDCKKAEKGDRFGGTAQQGFLHQGQEMRKDE